MILLFKPTGRSLCSKLLHSWAPSSYWLLHSSPTSSFSLKSSSRLLASSPAGSSYSSSSSSKSSTPSIPRSPATTSPESILTLIARIMSLANGIHRNSWPQTTHGASLPLHPTPMAQLEKNLAHDLEEVVDLCFWDSRTSVSPSSTTAAMATSLTTSSTSSLLVHRKRLIAAYLIAAHLLKQKKENKKIKKN